MVTRRPAEEIARLGDEIYEREIRHEVEDAHDGDFVAIDVESGSWALAESELGAAELLWERNVGLLRVGYRAIASIGGGSLRSGG